MAGDKLAFNPMFLSDELDIASPQNVVESVPVSQLRAYQQASYGPGLFHDPADRFANEYFYNAATAYSTDETLHEVLESDLTPERKVHRYMALWLKLSAPLVEATTMLEKATKRQLSIYDDPANPKRVSHELAVIVGNFWFATMISSVAVDVVHPVQLNPHLMYRPAARGQYPVVGGDPDYRTPHGIILSTSVVKVAHRKQAELLKQKVSRMNLSVEPATQRMIALMAAQDARKELAQILEEHSLSNKPSRDLL